MFAFVRKGVFIKCLNDDFQLFLEHLSVGISIQHRHRESFYLTRVVTSPNAECESPIAEIVNDSLVFGQPDGVPIQYYVESATYSYSFSTI